MPLSSSVLSSLIETNVKAQFTFTGFNDADLTKLCDAIADAVVTHITSAAVVAVASVSGVTTGPGVSGPGTGTIT